MKSHFDDSAKDWDDKKIRTANVKNISIALKKRITFSKEQSILDFGVGTGLLAWEIASQVKSIFGIDTSEEMLKVFRSKDWPCEIEAANIDLLNQVPDQKFDGIISSMTMHHVQPVEDYFKAFHKILKPGGFVAIADLEVEDGTFHTGGNEGVFYFGFEREDIKSKLENNGFTQVTFDPASVIRKEIANGEQREFPVFLLVAMKE